MPALDVLRGFDLASASTSLWLFKKRTKPDSAPAFTGRWVDTTDELDNALKEAVEIERNRIEEVHEYSLLGQNNESGALSIATIETHAGLVIAAAGDEVADKKLVKLKDIQNTNFYAVKFVSDDTTLYAVRKADASWRAKKQHSMISVVFADDQLGLDTDTGFNISKYVDFFIFDDQILISNKSHFESVLSYKEAHKEDFASLQAEPEFVAVFSDLELLIAYVGDNKINLRRASAIRQKGHYKNNGFMQNLRALHAQYGLQLNFGADGKIIPTADTCRDIMQALLDHRLTSAFSHNIYDVPDATSVAL